MSLSLLRIDYLLLGYRVMTVSQGDIACAADALLRAGLSARFSVGGEAIIPERFVKAVSAALLGEVEFELSPLCGLPGALMKSRTRYGMIIGLLLAVLIGALTQGLVWDVRVEGDEVREACVLDELRSAGFLVGSRWSSLSLSEVEAAVLESSERIGWININRRGNVAYIEVRERITHDAPAQKRGYANLVSKFDATVEEITVKRGTAAVKVGESVKAGELLISGLSADGVPSYAEGAVRARTSETVEVFVPRTETFKEYGEERLLSVRLEIFGFSLNIYKNSGNLGEECVIIEKTKHFSLPGGVKLPFSAVTEHTTEYTVGERELSDDELVALAAYRLRVKTASCLADADLIRISTSGEFTDGGYIMRSDIIAVRDIGLIVPFEAEK